MSYISEYLNRVMYIALSEGLTSLFRRAIRYLGRQLFIIAEYYVREHYCGELNKSDYLPGVGDHQIEIVSDNDAADRLASELGIDFRTQVINAERRLHEGAIAFCLFVGNELASIIWIGFTARAQKTLNSHPYFVNYADNEGFTDGAETMLKYRNRGLMACLCYHRNNYMKEHGIKTLIGIDAVDNIAIYKVQSKFPSRLRAKARYIKVLWWQYWKETPLPDNFMPPGFE